MRSTLVSLSLFAALTGQALAGVFITSPTATTTANGGQGFNVVWQDDGKSPSLATIGPCDISIYAGNVQQQTQLQQLGTVDVSQTTSLNATINAALGPNFNGYFVRVTSASLKDSSTGFPYEAFSAKFTLSGMSGTFTSAVQAQIDGASSLGTVGGSATTSAAGSSSTAANATLTTSRAASTASSAKTSGTSAPAPAKSNAAVNTGSNAVVLGAAMLLTGFVL